MTIGELSRRTGLPPSALRYYEQERLIPAPARRSGRRVFGEEALPQLTVVRLARDVGFTIAETRRLVTEFGRERWRRLAESKLAEVRAARTRLDTMTVLLEKLLGCECPDIAFCGRALARAARRPSRRSKAKRRAGTARR